MSEWFFFLKTKSKSAVHQRDLFYISTKEIVCRLPMFMP
jgi:hypothetical protein